MGRIEMELRCVLGVRAGAARLVAVLSAILMAAASGVVLGVGGPASAAAARPTVSLRVTGAESVQVSGRTATTSPRVRIDRKVGSHWELVKRTRARAHRYSTSLAVAAGTSATLRVTSNHRSRKVEVVMPARSTPTKTAPSTKKPTPVSSDECGARPLKADGSAWSCSFHDDFDGTTLDRTKWVPNTYFATWSGTTPACYRNDPANVNVTNGALNLTLVKLPAPEACVLPGVGPTQYMSGSVSSYHLFSQQYGRFEARIKSTSASAPGLHEAFWLWPDDRYATIDWPDSGEIDVSETFSAYPSVSGSYLHYSADHQGLFYGVNAANCAANRGEWNTYAVEWGPSRIETFVNGRSCLVNTSGDPAFQKRYIINLTQGIGGGSWTQLADGTPVPATMQVDYMRVWQ
jgi:beta-glucanase (GH16 family)